jgi:hypothetical protein
MKFLGRLGPDASPISGGFAPQFLSRPLSGSFRGVYFDIVIAGPGCATVDTLIWNNWYRRLKTFWFHW